MSPLDAALSVCPSVTSTLEPGTSVCEPILMAPEEAAGCAVRTFEPRVRIVGYWVESAGWEKVAVVLSSMMAFDAVESVWLPMTITEVSP